MFEEGSLGGRLATANIDGREYESGGSIIHNSNQLMLEFLDICGLQKKVPIPDETFSILSQNGPMFQVNFLYYFYIIYDYFKSIFQETGYSIVDKLRLAWKYGTFNLIKLERFYQSVLADFLKIYKSLKEGKGFKTTEEVLDEMNPIFVELTQTPLANHLSEEVGLPDPLIEDIVSAATKFNYGQLPSEMPAFVGAVALIGFDKQLWAVEGGNVRVAECALRLSGAKLERRRVGEITKEEDGRYRIDSSDELYDVIIIATPLTADTSDLRVDGERMVVPGSYHRTVATLVQAELNVSSLGVAAADWETSHYFFVAPEFPVWSVETMTPVDYSPERDAELPPVYRLFSHQPLTEAALSKMFSSIRHVSETDWLAYPHYPLGDSLGKFERESGLYHINSVETAASAMEMSVLGARNVVNLIRNDIRDTDMKSSTDKSEL